MTTHGDRWLSRTHSRILGWCITRGWRCGYPRSTRDGSYGCITQYSQFEIWVQDRFGREAPFVFELRADVPYAVDEYGIEQDFNAKTFDDCMLELARSVKPSKKQLELAL